MALARDLGGKFFGLRGGRILFVELTSGKVVLGTVALQFALFAIVFTGQFGIEVPLLREILAFVYLTFVPGYLLVRLFGISPQYRVESLLYAVGLSLAFLMLVGLLANFGLRAVGVTYPISEVPVFLAVNSAVLLLAGLYYLRVDDERRVSVDIEAVNSPIMLTLALLPFIGIFGALLITRFDINILLLVLYGAIAVVPILVLRQSIPTRLLPIIVWLIAISLLLQNTLTGQYLAWGDQPKEAGLALHVLRTGFWEPSQAPALGGKYSLLRIVILHPIYALFTNLKLIWVFKLVHPLLFSIMPVALYQAYRRVVDEELAFLSVYLFVSLFSFYVVLSRNTRTSSALLFLALMALLIVDNDLAANRRKLLAMVFIASIIVAHYGVSYVVLFGLVAVLGLIHVYRALIHPDDRSIITHPLTTYGFVLFYTLLTFSWYMYASPGAKAYGLLVGFVRKFVQKVMEFYSLSATSATTRYVTTDFNSITLDILKMYNLVIGAVIALGIAGILWRFYQKENIGFNTEYLTYAIVFLGIFGITFLPVERFNTARTFPTTLIFFAPFFVIGIGYLLRLIRRNKEVSSKSVKQVAAVAVVAYFLLNVGFISATLTHQYSPNILVEKDRVMDDGHPVEKAYFYKQYPTTYGVESTTWLKTNGIDDSLLYRSLWPGGLQGAVGYESWTIQPLNDIDFRGRPITVDAVEGGRLGEGYVYLNAYNVIGNVIRLPSGHFGYRWVYRQDAKTAWKHKSRIYSNGGSIIYT